MTRVFFTGNEIISIKKHDPAYFAYKRKQKRQIYAVYGTIFTGFNRWSNISKKQCLRLTAFAEDRGIPFSLMTVKVVQRRAIR